MKLRALLMLCLAGGGCGPRLLYYGHDPLRIHRIEVVEQGGQQFVRYAGKEQTRYRGIGLAGLTMSEDGQHLAYPAQRRGSWLVVRDEKEEADWDDVGPLLWSRDSRHLLYSARRGATWQVVLDGRAGPPWERILAGTLTLSADGAHHAYVAAHGNRVQVVYDGQPQTEYDGVAKLSMSAQGAHLGYLARQQNSAYVRCDGAQAGPYQMIAELVQGAAGECAFIAKQGFRWRVFVGDKELGDYDSAAGLTMSATGELAYVARQGSQERVVRRGAQDPPYRKIDWQSLAFSADGQHFAYVARTAEGALLVYDGAPGAQFADVQGLQLSGGHYAYVATLASGESRVVSDGQPGPLYSEIADLQLSPDGTRALYLAQRGARVVVVSPQGEFAFPLILPSTLAWSRDGQRWGCLAGTELRSLHVLVDGKPQRDFPIAEYYHARLRTAHPGADPRDDVLRAWVSAELARPIDGTAPP